MHHAAQNAHCAIYAIVELRDNVYIQSDLDGFFRLYDPDQVGNHPTLVSIAGGKCSSEQLYLHAVQPQRFLSTGSLNTSTPESDEATMDLQLVMGLLGRKQEVLLYQLSTDTDRIDSRTCPSLRVSARYHREPRRM